MLCEMKKTIISLILVLSALCGMAQNATLKGRKVAGVLPLPESTIQAEGIVVVTIWVDQYGTVQKATAGVEGTTLVDTNAWAAARKAALGAHFNTDAKAPALQEGTITYIFTIPAKETPEQSSSVKPEQPKIDPQNVFTFRGVPIGGSKEYVEEQLNALGYRRDFPAAEYLEGEFNGEDVKVYVHTHQGTVDRIKVEFPYERDDVARVKYNNLISRFGRNEKFTSLVNIPRISAEIDDKKASKNLYDATYFQLTDGTNISSWRTEVNSKVVRTTGTTVDKISHEELEECLNGMSPTLLSKVAGVVWVSFESYGPLYRVVLYYDNLDNRPRGEDL